MSQTLLILEFNNIHIDKANHINYLTFLMLPFTHLERSYTMTFMSISVPRAPRRVRRSKHSKCVQVLPSLRN